LKLYYSPGACSLAVRILAAEVGILLDFESVTLADKRTASGEDYSKVNPKRVVPALVLDSGELLTEGPVIMQYLADQKPESGLAPLCGTLARYRLQETLGYLNSEVHTGYSPMFHPMPDDARADRKRLVQAKYPVLEARLADHSWLVGDRFTIADIYLFTLTNWAPYLDVDLSMYQAVQAFQLRMFDRATVRTALQAEGLIPAA
jgi:glutathione S-transferase